MDTLTIRRELHEYIETADDKEIEAIYTILKGEVDEPYEWWNDTVAARSRAIGWQLINFTPGIRTNADYTYPEMGRSYLSSDAILQSLKQYQSTRTGGLNGAIILIHAGTDPRRKDKLYNQLGQLLGWLQANGYRCVPVSKFL